MNPCDNCGFVTDDIYIVENGEKGLCSECAFSLDKQQYSIKGDD